MRSGKDEADDESFEMKISTLRNTLAEAESDITRATACKLREHIVRMRENFASEKKRLNTEIQRLKKRAKEAEEKRWSYGNGFEAVGHLKLRLREYASGDRTMEMIFKDIVGRIAVTVPNLSEELVNASEDLYRSNCENGRLRYEIDDLKAMIRINTGDPESLLKRIVEFKEIARGLTKNISRLRSNMDGNGWNENWDFWKYLEVVKRIQETMYDLGKKVKTDRQALMTAGNPICFRYIKKIVSVRLILKQLHAELDNTLTQIDKRGIDREISETKQCIERVSLLKKIIKRTSVELGRLKIEPANNCRVGGTSCLEYLKKVRIVEESLDKCKRKITELDVEPTTEGDYSRVCRSKTLDELKQIVDELCSRLKDLEDLVYSGDDSKLSERIEELEDLLVKSKLELSTKEETVASLEERLERGKKELEESHEKNAILAKKIDTFEEDSKNHLAEMRRVKAELDTVKMQLQSLNNDKENLFTEAENMRKQLMEKNEEISKKLTTRDASLRKLHDALDKASKEKEELTKKLTQIESPRARTERELNQTRSNLSEANNTIADLRKKLDRAIAESQRFEQEAIRLSSENETLNQRSCDVKEAREEYKSLLARHTTLESKIDNCDRESSELRVEIAELRAERKLLKSGMDELERKNGSLVEQVEKLKITRATLEEEANGWKIRSSELASILERANGELRELRADNSVLSADLGALTLKNNEAAARLRAASTEKDDLATRTKELNEENVSLKDRLNKVRAEREYLSQELNKSRIECDKTRSRIVELGQTIEEQDDKYNEMKSRYEKLEEQTRSLRASNETLRSENEALKARSSEFLERVRIVTEANEDDDTLWSEQDKKKGKKDSIKPRDKLKPKEKLISETKMLRVANESLKLELANLKTENAEIRTELLRLKNESIGRATDAVEITELRSIFVKSRDGESRASSSRAEQRHGSSPREATLDAAARDELKKKFETLSSTLSKLKIVNGALKTEIDVLRESMHAAITDKERAIDELRRTLDELKALKSELIKLRNEKGTLRTRLDDSKQELDSLRTEKAALKDELSLLRHTNLDLRTKIGVLQDSYEKLKTFNVRLENKLEGTLKHVSKYTVSSENPNEFENELNGILKDYASIRESLGIANRQLDNQKFAQGESTNV